MKIEDVLAPWEYDVNAPPTKWVDGGAIEFESRLVRVAMFFDKFGSRLAFRFEGDDGSWTVDGRLGGTSREEMAKCVALVLKDSFYSRYFPVESDEVMKIGPNGIGHWVGLPMTSPTNSWPTASVRFGLGRRVSKMKSSQTRAWLERLLSRPASDVTFSRSFNWLNPDQRRQQLFGFGTEEELRNAEYQLTTLCNRVLQADAALWSASTRISWNLLAYRDRRPACFVIFGGKGKSKPRLDFWAKILDEYGPLHADRSRLCFREWFDQSPTLVHGQLETRTAHEQLEAHLELRAWAKLHLPPDVQMELERFESYC